MRYHAIMSYIQSIVVFFLFFFYILEKQENIYIYITNERKKEGKGKRENWISKQEMFIFIQLEVSDVPTQLALWCYWMGAFFHGHHSNSQCALGCLTFMFPGNVTLHCPLEAQKRSNRLTIYSTRQNLIMIRWLHQFLHRRNGFRMLPS